MAVSPLKPLNFPIDSELNFYEHYSLADTCGALKIPGSCSFTFDGCPDNAMSSYFGSPDFTSWPGNMSGGTALTDGPENDHTYNKNENSLKCELSDYNPTMELNMYTCSSFSDANVVKMEDDVFQVDKNDLIQWPTLAELNADSSLLDFDPLEFDDMILPGEERSAAILRNELVSKSEECRGFNGRSASVISSDDLKNVMKREPTKRGNYEKKARFFNESGVRSLFTNNLATKTDHDVQLPVLAPIKKEIICEQANQESSLVANNVEASQENEHLPASMEINSWNGESNDEGFDSDSDVSDHESFDELRPQDKFRNQEKYFWQYNLQAKGPKTQTVTLSNTLEDPHFLQSITDPVFNPECQVIVKGIKHTGKARKGDGNDLNPCPDKLHAIGKELKKLNRIINEISSNDADGISRSSCRKEKNKLASRVCRLKKKAQHEANKLKLYALQHEHKKYIECIDSMKKMFKQRVESSNGDRSLAEELNDIASSKISKNEIAGRTSEFINGILENVSRGVPQGGLNMR